MFKKIFHNRYLHWYQHAKQLFFFDIILLIAIVVITGTGVFFYFYGFPVTSKIDLTVTPKAPIAEFISGEPFAFDVQYKNNSEALLRDVQLTVLLPNGYIPESFPDEYDKTSNTLTLPDLSPGANGTATITGQLLLSTDSTTTLIALISYKQESRSVREQKTTALTLVPQEHESIIGLSINQHGVTPKTVFYTQQLATTELIICNMSDVAPLPPVTIQVNHPDFASPSQGENAQSTFTLDFPIEPGDPCHIQELALTPRDDVEKESEFVISTRYSGNTETITIHQAKQPYQVRNPKPQLTLTSTESIFSPGKQHAFTLNLENPHEMTLQDIILTIPQSPFFSTKTFTKQTHPELNALAPNESTQILVTINTKANQLEDTPSITITPQVSFSLNDLSQALNYSGEPLTLLIPAQPRLSANARYFSPYGDQLGRGPLPPIVGQQTKYWIFVNASAQYGTIDNSIIELTTAPHVQFTNKQSVSSGSVSAPSSRSRVWNLGSIPGGKTEGLFLEVALTPSPEQVNANVALIQNATLVGIDSATQTSVSVSLGSILSSLTSDTFAQDYTTEVLPAP